jgi:hypothetical protein
MATWTNVSSTVLEPGDPIRSVDIIAIKENIIALSEGASGAPKILTAAINDAAVTTAKLADSNVTTAKLATGERMNTTNVLAATAGASVGAVGTYAACQQVAMGTTRSPGATLAGSGLDYSSFSGSGTTSPSGTWRLMGQIVTTSETAAAANSSLWLRIS